MSDIELGGLGTMADDWFTPLAAVLLAPLAVLNAGAEIKLGITSPRTGRRGWSGDERHAGAYPAPADPDAAGAMLDQSLALVLVCDCGDPDQATGANQLAADSVLLEADQPCSGAAIVASSIHENVGIGPARSRRKDDVERATATDAELVKPGRI
jgi:ABC-type branched-subunit amino acid transport system substrate-binding protein